MFKLNVFVKFLIGILKYLLILLKVYDFFIDIGL